jgi:hypothetical protein
MPMREGGEDDADAGLVAEGCAQVQGVAVPEQPVEGDVATVCAGGNVGVGPRPHCVPGGGVHVRRRAVVGFPLPVEPALHLPRRPGHGRIGMVGEQTDERGSVPPPTSLFEVPIVYFFLPPPDTGLKEVADTRRPISELYASLLGHEWQLEPVDERLGDINISNPDASDRVLAAIFGAEGAARNWHESFRTWRKKRLNEVAREYGDRLDEVALFLAEFAERITTLGPRMYLQSQAHRDGENVSVILHDEEE